MNFINFKPGLVGVIVVRSRSYYLTYKLRTELFSTSFEGRELMTMGVDQLAETNISSKCFNTCVTFKNCPDIRNTKVVDLCKKPTNISYTVVFDPLADIKETLKLILKMLIT